jgi:large subunit ribosomal protein L19
MDKLVMVEQEMLASLKKDYPGFGSGDMIKVYYIIKDADKERIHPIEGVVIKVQGAMHRKSFTIRRVVFGEAYEATFPYYSPNIAKIEVSRKVAKQPRRKRLFYMRGHIGREAMQA